jgi:hypothetical protein
MKLEIEELLRTYSIDEVLTGLANYFYNKDTDDDNKPTFKTFERKLRKLSKELGDL